LISKEDIEYVNPSALVSKTKGDRSIWFIVILLTLFSCLTVYSSTSALAYKISSTPEGFLKRQIVFVILSLAVMYFSHLIHYKYYSRIALVLFYLTLPLLLFTLLAGRHVNDASRWIEIPLVGITFQTSDLAKLSIIMYTARMLSRKQDVIHDFKKGFVPLMWPIIAIFILILPANLSTAAILLLTCLVLLFFGRINLKQLFLFGICGLMLVLSFVFIAKMVGYEGRIKTWESRIASFNSDAKDEVPFQTQQANIAIAKGGITGVGPGNSTQRNFLPHSDSDFIFAIIIEEYGLWASILLMIIYLWFLFRCIKIFLKCPGAFGSFLAVGLGFALVIQALMHMSVNVHLTPVTGVTLPFISMGGTSLLFTSLATGIILSVSKHVEEEQQLLQEAELKKAENSTAETKDIQESEAPF
jgi:cell division protein FtsW